MDADSVHEGLVESSGSDSSDEDQVATCSETEEGQGADEAWPEGFDELWNTGCVLYRHRYFKTLHWAVNEESSNFACGRVISRACSLVVTLAALDKPVCIQCSDATGYREVWDRLGV